MNTSIDTRLAKHRNLKSLFLGKKKLYTAQKMHKNGQPEILEPEHMKNIARLVRLKYTGEIACFTG